MSRRLLKEEGLFCGGSSGTIMHAAILYAKKHNLNENHRMVVVLPDNLRNYMTKHINKEWCIEKGILPLTDLKEPSHPLGGISIDKLNLTPVKTWTGEETIEEAL